MRSSKIRADADDIEDADEADGEDEALWAVSNASDDDDYEPEDEDINHHQHPLRSRSTVNLNGNNTNHAATSGQEGLSLMAKDDAHDNDDDIHGAQHRSVHFSDDNNDFGHWSDARPS